jgi:hypothetical protein
MLLIFLRFAPYKNGQCCLHFGGTAYLHLQDRILIHMCVGFGPTESRGEGGGLLRASVWYELIETVKREM